jgi:hypothetical protein
LVEPVVEVLRAGGLPRCKRRRKLSMHACTSLRLAFALCLVSTVACSAGTPIGFGEDGGTPSTTPTGTGTSTPPPPDTADASSDKATDAGPAVDKSPRFDLELDGQPVAIENVEVKVEPASGSTPARISVAGQYEQQLGFGQTSTAKLTLYVDASEKGTDACGVGGRSASYLFKDTEGAITVLATDLQGGNCTMKVVGNASDAFTSGSVTGVLSGEEQKSFTLAWGQAIPKS